MRAKAHCDGIRRATIHIAKWLYFTQSLVAAWLRLRRDVSRRFAHWRAWSGGRLFARAYNAARAHADRLNRPVLWSLQQYCGAARLPLGLTLILHRDYVQTIES